MIENNLAAMGRLGPGYNMMRVHLNFCKDLDPLLRYGPKTDLAVSFQIQGPVAQGLRPHKLLITVRSSTGVL